MKTFEETFKDHIDLTDGTVVLTKEQFKLIQHDVIVTCQDLCLEGKQMLQEMSPIASIACDECAKNIGLLTELIA